jgi:hypothetical protein
MTPQMMARSPISRDRGTRLFSLSQREGTMRKNDLPEKRRSDRARVVYTDDRQPRDRPRHEISPDDGFVRTSVGCEEEQRPGEMDA